MRIVNVNDVGIKGVEALLKKAAFDEVELSPKIREGNRRAKSLTGSFPKCVKKATPRL